jgi:hypothetical protein
VPAIRLEEDAGKRLGKRRRQMPDLKIAVEQKKEEMTISDKLQQDVDVAQAVWHKAVIAKRGVTVACDKAFAEYEKAQLCLNTYLKCALDLAREGK